MSTELTYSNPRMRADIDNWPWGSNLRTTAIFQVETSKRGQRTVRTTLNPKTGEPCAAKALTYSVRQRIVDGSDGKTYILSLSMYGFISVMQSNMQFQQESVSLGDDRFLTMRSLVTMEVA